MRAAFVNLSLFFFPRRFQGRLYRLLRNILLPFMGIALAICLMTEFIHTQHLKDTLTQAALEAGIAGGRQLTDHGGDAAEIENFVRRALLERLQILGFDAALSSPMNITASMKQNRLTVSAALTLEPLAIGLIIPGIEHIITRRQIWLVDNRSAVIAIDYLAKHRR